MSDVENPSAALLMLAERCEKAEGPDRELDAAIAPVLNLRAVDEGHPLGWQCYNADHRAVPFPRFTASLDAAMTLVPEGWLTGRATQDFDSAEWHWSIYPPFNHAKRVWGQSASAPLALCAAALRAHAALISTGGQ